jgi:hypothetical protein
MNEENLFDDISRILASSIPRRQAFGQIVRGIAGAALVSVFGLETARAAGCPPGQASCGTTCCPKGWDCCSNTTCCNPSQGCDGKKCKGNISPPAINTTGK